MKFDPARYAFWMCCGGTMCLAIASNLPPVFLTTFSEEFGGAAGLTEEQLGRVAALVFGGFVSGVGLVSPLADRWGARPFVTSGLLVLCGGLALLGAANGYSTLLVAAFLLGLGAGNLEVVLSPVVAALQPHRRAAALNWMHAAYSFGAVGTVLAGSAALRYGVPWRTATFAIIGAPALVLIGFAFAGRLPLVHDEAAHEPVRRLLRHRFLWAAMVLIALGGGTELGIAQWLPAYAERGLGYSKAWSGMSLAAFSVAMLAGRVVIGHWLTRENAASAMLAFCGVCVVLLVTAGLAPVREVALAASILIGFGVCCFWPTTLGLAGDRYPRGGASMFGLLAAAGNIGAMAAPWCVGVIAERSALNVGIAATALCPAAMAAILMVIARHARTPR